MAQSHDNIPHLTVDTSADEAGLPVISVTGELDLASAPQLSSATKPVVEDGADQVVFDLSGIEFMDSSGLRVLLEVAAKVDAVHVRSASRAARRVIESAGVDQVLQMQS